MATFDILIGYDQESRQLTVSETDIISEMSPGDRLRFVSGFGTNAGSITISGLGPIWTSGSNFTMPSSRNSSVTRTLRTGSSGVGSDTIDVTRSFTSSKSFQVVSSVADRSPNTFNWSNVNNLDPKTEIVVGTQRIVGINRTVNITVTGGTYYVLRFNKVTRTATVKNQDKIMLVASPFTDYGQSKQMTVKIGDAPLKRITLSARTSPLIDQVIPIGIPSGRISLRGDVQRFFGGEEFGAAKLTDYYKGGRYIPTIDENFRIPTSGTIKLTDFYGAHTAYYFTIAPLGLAGNENTISSSKNITLVWHKSDWGIGFGDGLEDLSQYAFAVDITDISSGDGPTITGASSSFSVNNSFVRLSLTVPARTERFIFGTVTISARNVLAGALRTISRTLPWSMAFWGP